MEVAASTWALVVLLLSKRSITKDVLQNLSMPRAKILFSGSTTVHGKNSSYQHFLLQKLHLAPFAKEEEKGVTRRLTRETRCLTGDVTGLSDNQASQIRVVVKT
jgi:hypothetical protein